MSETSPLPLRDVDAIADEWESLYDYERDLQRAEAAGQFELTRAASLRIFVVSDPSLNAFVAGGQNLFIHTGLIEAALRSGSQAKRNSRGPRSRLSEAKTILGWAPRPVCSITARAAAGDGETVGRR